MFLRCGVYIVLSGFLLFEGVDVVCGVCTLECDHSASCILFLVSSFQHAGVCFVLGGL